MQMNERLAFGRYKDKPLAEVDTQYIVWTLNRPNIKFDNPTLTRALMRELQTRLNANLGAVLADMAARPAILSSKKERLKSDREQRLLRAARDRARYLNAKARLLGVEDLV